MSELHGHHEVKVGGERGFGLVFAVVFAVIAAWPLMDGGAPRLWALVVAAGFLAVTWVRPRWLRPLNLVWFRFGLWLGAVVAPIVMALVFFLVVTPTGWLVRALGKDPLRLKLDRQAPSYWIERDEENNPMGSMKNQF